MVSDNVNDNVIMHTTKLTLTGTSKADEMPGDSDEPILSTVALSRGSVTAAVGTTSAAAF